MTVFILHVAIFYKHFFLELPYKVNMEASITEARQYHKDVAINKWEVTVSSGKGQILCNIRKKNVAFAWQGLDLIEALLYAKYYMQAEQSREKIITID